MPQPGQGNGLRRFGDRLLAHTGFTTTAGVRVHTFTPFDLTVPTDPRPGPSFEVTGDLVENPPAPAAITSEETITGLGITHITLANGVQVYLKPTDFKDDEVILSSHSPGGESVPASSWARRFRAICAPVRSRRRMPTGERSMTAWSQRRSAASCPRSCSSS